MSLTLNQALERVRRDLGDVDVANAVWTTDQLQRHLEHALDELSLAIPREQKTTLTTTADSRDIDVSSLSDLLHIEAVEWPTGNYPPTYVRFSLWANTLTLLVSGAPAAVENVDISWRQMHTIDPAGTTLPQWAEEILVRGAVGYAAQERSIEVANSINIGGPNTQRSYSQLASDALNAFRQALRSHGDQGSLRTSSLYTPATPLPSQSTDPGP